MSDERSLERNADDPVPPRMKIAFAQIVLIEAAIIVALWVLGRVLS